MLASMCVRLQIECYLHRAFRDLYKRRHFPNKPCLAFDLRSATSIHSSPATDPVHIPNMFAHISSVVSVLAAAGVVLATPVERSSGATSGTNTTFSPDHGNMGAVWTYSQTNCGGNALWAYTDVSNQACIDTPASMSLGDVTQGPGCNLGGAIVVTTFSVEGCSGSTQDYQVGTSCANVPFNAVQISCVQTDQ